MPAGASARTDDQAFAAMLEQATPRLRAFVVRLSADRDEVEDVLQEALAKLWRLRHTFDPRRLPGENDAVRWLQRGVFRTYCDHRRRRRRQPAASDALHHRAAPDEPCAAELRDELRHRLAKLTDIERTLLLGFHRDGLDLRELARHHRLPVNTVKSHLHRARRRLHQSHGADS